MLLLLLIVFFKLPGKGSEVTLPPLLFFLLLLFFSFFLSRGTRQTKDWGCAGWKKDFTEAALLEKKAGRKTAFSFFVLHREVKSRGKAGRKAWADPVTATLTFRKLEKKQIKLPS